MKSKEMLRVYQLRLFGKYHHILNNARLEFYISNEVYNTFFY